MFIIKIDKEKCKSCRLCIDMCPNKIFRISNRFNKMGYHYVEADNEVEACTGCKRCVAICPDVAIELYKEEEKEKG